MKPEKQAEAPMKIHLLRSVAVSGSQGITTPYSEPARCFLAALAWHPNQTVPDATIVRYVWGERPPRQPRASLYTCATRLRDAIQEADPPADRTCLRRECGGYRLAVEPLTIDVHASRGLLRQAGEAVRKGDDHAAVALFDRGLAMFGSLPFPGLSSEWATRARTGLHQERRSAEVVRAEAGLRLGRHVEETPMLFRLADDHPLDERIAGLLMSALYRCGRQQDALLQYAAIRERMVAELGSEPSGELHELHVRILRRDPALATHEGLQDQSV